MVRICDIDNFFNNFCPKDLSEEWDNDGVMLCKDTQKQINKVLCALEITPECVNFAKKNNADKADKYGADTHNYHKKVFG